MTFPSFHCLHLLFTFLTEPHSPPLSHPLCTPPLFPTDSDNHLFPLILFYMVSFTSSYKMSLFLCHLISAFTPLYQLSLSHFRNSTTQQMWTCCRWTQRGCLFCLPQQCRSSSWKCSHGEQAAASCMWTRWMWSTGGSLPPGCSVSTSTGLCCPRYESFFFLLLLLLYLHLYLYFTYNRSSLHGTCQHDFRFSSYCINFFALLKRSDMMDSFFKGPSNSKQRVTHSYILCSLNHSGGF